MSLKLVKKAPVRMGVVGCGVVADYGHIPAINRCKEARLVGFADPDKARCEAQSKKYGAPCFESFEEMGYFHLTQGARQELKTFRFPHEQSSATPTEGLDQLFAWLHKPSPICRFVKDYLIVYPHLCAANAFVPVGKVCNVEPPRQIPPIKQELWKVLAEVNNLDYVPGLRVNYRKYGLDEDTRKAIRELAQLPRF